MNKFVNIKSALIILVVIVIALGYIFKGLIIAATVNGSPISRLTVIRALEKQSGKSVLDNLITEELILSEANKRNITIPQEEIDTILQDIEKQVASQGQTLNEALLMQNMSREELVRQITNQKKLEFMLGDKIQVTTEEVNKYIKENKIVRPTDMVEIDFRTSIENQLRQQKVGTEASMFITNLRDSASIGRYVSY